MDSRCWLPVAQGHEPFHYSVGTRITSVQSVTRTPMKFINETPIPVKLKWLNFMGAEVEYGTVEPGKPLVIQTFLTHPWTFQSADEKFSFMDQNLSCGRKKVVFPNPCAPDVHIELAPSKVWTPKSHKAGFSHDLAFAAQVRALLLVFHAHNKQRRADWTCNPTACHDREANAGLQHHHHTRGSSGVRAEGRANDSLVPSSTEMSPSDRRSTLGSIPTDVLHDIIRFMAPQLPDLLLVELEDMSGRPDEPPPGLHEVQAAFGYVH